MSAIVLLKAAHVHSQREKSSELIEFFSLSHPALEDRILRFSMLLWRPLIHCFASKNRPKLEQRTYETQTEVNPTLNLVSQFCSCHVNCLPDWQTCE